VGLKIKRLIPSWSLHVAEWLFLEITCCGGICETVFAMALLGLAVFGNYLGSQYSTEKAEGISYSDVSAF